LQDQINERTLSLSVKSAKITGQLLAKMMQAFLKKAREPTYKKGKQSLKSLAKQGASLTNVTIDGDNIGSFNRIARKYNVDFSLKRDNSIIPPRWHVFFKAKDNQALESAFKEFSHIPLKHKTRKPPFLEKLAKFIERAKSAADPVKNRNRGGHEL